MNLKPLYCVASPVVICGPGRPRKKPRSDNMERQWFTAIETELQLAVNTFEAYTAAYFCYHGSKKAIVCEPTKF